jgi:hypothetical protein
MRRFGSCTCDAGAGPHLGNGREYSVERTALCLARTEDADYEADIPAGGPQKRPGLTLSPVETSITLSTSNPKGIVTDSTWFLTIAIIAIALQALTIFLAFFEPSLKYKITEAPSHPLGSVGSTNFDHRSFSINDEVNLAASDERMASELNAHFAEDVLRSYDVTYDQRVRRPIWERMHEGLGWIVERQE